MRDGEPVTMSKRSGKAIALSDLLDEVPVDAARYFFNSRPESPVEFDLDLAVRQDSENPVYYVQYAHARICTLIAALAAQGHRPEDGAADASLLTTPEERELIVRGYVSSKRQMAVCCCLHTKGDGIKAGFAMGAVDAASMGRGGGNTK